VKDIFKFLGYVAIFLMIMFLISFAYFYHYQEQFVKECVAVGGEEEDCRNID